MNEDGALVPPAELRRRLGGPDPPTVIDVRILSSSAQPRQAGDARRSGGPRVRGAPCPTLRAAQGAAVRV